MIHEPHCPVPRAVSRGENAVCLCRPKRMPPENPITGLTVAQSGEFSYWKDGISHSACFDLFLIAAAWHRGCNFEALADGYGDGQGTFGDWSGIRDSSDKAREVMLERALNFLGLGTDS